ncbi:MAG: hypothetical protein R6X02_31325 [Enhygromyxa sp.]
MPIRLGVVIDDESLLRTGRRDDPVDVVVLRWTFLNPPRAAAARRIAERIRGVHDSAELIPYAWHYLTHEPGDGVVVGSNRSLEPNTGSYGHLRGDAREHVWSITKICAEALGAARVVLRTPPSFSPGSLSRRRFKSFVESLEPTDPKLLWEPEGLWTPAQAAAFALELGVEVIAPAFAMTGQLLEFDGASWLRVGGSKDAKLRASHAEILADALVELAETEPLTLLFEGPKAYANLRAFARACLVSLEG